MVLSAPVPAREARLRRFRTLEGEVVDEGLALYFPGPNSFTGEDVLELQGHGGLAVLDRVLMACLSAQTSTHPIRLAAPGEFSQRAFLNDRLDLLQAEAISDLVAPGHMQQPRRRWSRYKGVSARPWHLCRPSSPTFACA